MPDPSEPADVPPDEVRYDLDGALSLLAALEDARDAPIASSHLVVVMSIEEEVRILSRKLGFGDAPGGPLSDAPLRVSEAARQLGIPTKELLALIHGRRIDYVMQDGIAYVPADAIEGYRARGS